MIACDLKVDSGKRYLLFLARGCDGYGVAIENLKTVNGRMEQQRVLRFGGAPRAQGNP